MDHSCFGVVCGLFFLYHSFKHSLKFFFLGRVKRYIKHACNETKKLPSDPSQFDCPGISIKKKVQNQWNGHFFLPCIHMNMYQPWISFKLSKKTDWLLLQNTRSGVLHLHPHCVFNPIQSRGSSSRPVCKKTCFKTFYGGELKNFPMQTNKTLFFFNLNKLQVIHRFKT